MSGIPKHLEAFDIKKVDFLDFGKSTRPQFLWNKLLEYVQNKQKKSMFSKYIALQNWRKEIYDLYESFGLHKKTFVEYQNVFKCILHEQVIQKMKKTPEIWPKEKNEMLLIYSEFINSKDLYDGEFLSFLLS